ncbi:MAG: carbohydrate kinase [Bacteroidetes bacterium]|nr:MAG: carbohydrate kinase [Bacteroidota bacterium]
MEWTEQFIKDISKRHILVIGDLMLDRYLWGRVDRISPEAPVPILQLQSSHNRMGGAANVAFNLAQLGCRSSLIGVVGEDTNGDHLLQLIRDGGIGGNSISRISDVPTTTKTRVIAGNQHILRVDDEEILHPSKEQEDTFVQQVADCLRETRPDAIILQDYNKGVLTPDIIAALLDEARALSIPVAVDPKFDNFFAYKGVAVFKPNMKELAAQYSFPIEPTTESLDRASRELRQILDHEVSCITLSEHGLYIDDGNISGVHPTTSLEVVDVCGAGDAVISVLTLGYLSNLTPEQLAIAANVAGGAVCEHVGVTPITIEVLKKGLRVERIL